MPPKFTVGPRGGLYVMTETGKKIYIPKTVTHWEKKGPRWRFLRSQ